LSLARAIAAAVHGEEVPAALLEAAFSEILRGTASPVAVAALLVALRTKGETVGEIAAAARVLRAHAETAPLPDPRTVDTCGTGGDGCATFNISTAAAFVVAGAGVPVAKHGNRAATSRSGSFDVLEALGVHADLDVGAAAKLLVEVGIAPFYARRAHPAMRFVAEVRREIPVPTLMNCMGPLLNPVGARRQLVGVYASHLVEPLARVLGELGTERALVVHGSDGLDEITTTGPTDAALLAGGGVRPLTLDAADLGIPRARLGDLAGGDAAENARITRAILAGEAGAKRDIVVVNAAAAIWVAEAAVDLAEGVRMAEQSLDSGAALARLEALITASRRLARP
jgi:anthranilate phosphoribosyltransferase